MALVMLSGLPALPPASGLAPHGPILINGDAEFTPANGVTRGTGTTSDPYVIEGWDITSTAGAAIQVQNTNAAFVIRDARVQSPVYYAGVYLYNVANGTVQNVTAHDSGAGVSISASRDITITRSNVTMDDDGVSVGNSSRVTIRDSRFTRIANASVALLHATEARLSGNTFESRGVWIFGRDLSDYNTHVVSPDNLLDGRPVAYYANSANIDLDGVPVGQLILANCTNVRAGNLTITGAYTGIQMAYVDQVSVSDSNVSGNIVGMDLYEVSNLTVHGNSFFGNRRDGIKARSVVNATFSANDFTDTGYGLVLQWTPLAAIVGNNFTRNVVGLGLYAAAWEERVHHNNFVENFVQAYEDWLASAVWDDGYPSGGNYWSDYSGTDRCSGPAQDACPDPDGFGDVPHHSDRYPFMNPFFPGADAEPPLTTASFSGTQGRAGWYVSNVTVTLTARDNGTGVTSTWYNINGNMWTLYTGPFAIDPDGVHAVEFYSRDMAGNNDWPQFVTVRIDTTAPSTDFLPTGAEGRAGWYASNVTVALDADDNTSGAAYAVYRLDGGPNLTYTGAFLLKEGRHIVEYHSGDVAGNAEMAKTTTIKIDLTPPAFGAASPSGTVTRSDVVVTWGATDATSGIDHYAVSIDGSAFESTGSNSSVARALSDGEHRIRVRAVDVAGNVAETEVAFRIDTNIFSPTGPSAGAPTYAIVILAAITVLLQWRRHRARAP